MSAQGKQISKYLILNYTERSLYTRKAKVICAPIHNEKITNLPQHLLTQYAPPRNQRTLAASHHELHP